MDTPSRRASSAQVAWSRAGMWAACAELARRLGVSNIEKSYIFGILMKNTKYVSASSIGQKNFHSGHPYWNINSNMLSHAFNIDIQFLCFPN